MPKIPRVARCGFALLVASPFLLAGASGCGKSAGGSSSNPTAPAPAEAPASASPYWFSADGNTLIGPGEDRFPVRDGAVTGYVDSVAVAGETLYVSGWAAAGTPSIPAQRVVGVVGDRGIAVANTGEDRSDVADALGQALARSGFSLSFTRASLDCETDGGELAVLAIAGGRADPLAWVEKVPGQLREAAC